MPDGQILEFSEVTKRFGTIDAVSRLSARIEPGLVTGFLGPNGAGKTTSLRMLLGLVRPTSGTTTIGGSHYSELRDPLRTVGAALEASSFHPGRSGANHLKVYAQAAGLPTGRIDETLALVGLSDAAGRKVGGYSLGMRQRLGLATALLGDPGVLVLDEPSNGLDPEGIKWMRMLLRAFADEGRTVLVSSHLLMEIQQTADRLLILARGRLVFDGGIEDLADPDEYATVVDAPDRAALEAALTAAGHSFEVLRSGLTVRGAEPVEVGALAAASGIALSGLQRRGPELEEIFLALVDGTRVHPPVGVVAAIPAVDEDAPLAPENDPAPETSEITEAPDVEVPLDTPVPEGAVEAAREDAAAAGEDAPADRAADVDVDEPAPASDDEHAAADEAASPSSDEHADAPASEAEPALEAEPAPTEAIQMTEPMDGTEPHPEADDREEGGRA
ncbi:ABC-2 type transport system ATP-binding protein [Microbacterium sp. SORGH_AS428]|uniref:ABC transporter ATP-binding protein n=1 Tax=Microbacterium sp. SORGH_AS_0428 TaxID=3041788 RepID=UPI002864753B|nr:ATP-binding cassette domain-containing protein [Microbacterium sp. SORGH_AS_0428]MDR6199528.1 ABC-2 type transport system ATP-binding protein [Microbacterium sp. SORGH_AS_0428]